jgi:hypothetical protein
MIDWREEWRAFDLPEKEGYFLRELRWEIRTNESHVLYGKDLRIVGWIPGYDDFLLQLLSEDRYVYVHLTWHRENQPDFPYCELLDSVEAVNEFLEKWSEEGSS